MFLSLFKNNPAQTVPLNIEHKAGGRLIINIGLPHTLSLGEVSAVMRLCQECSDGRQAHFQGLVIDVFTTANKMTPRFVASVLAWRCQEKVLLEELQSKLQPIFHVRMVPVWRH